MKENKVVFASAARTASPTPATIISEFAQGLFFINVTAATGTPSVVFTISGVSPNGSVLYTVLASAAITGTGLTVLRVSPYLTAAANTIAKDILPSALHIAPVHTGADSITYSMHYIGMP